MIKNLLVIFLALLCFACTTHYSEIPQAEPHATIKGEPRKGLFNPPQVGFLEINGLPTDNTWKGYGAKRSIPAGKNSIFVIAYTGGALTASTSVELDAVAGIDYIASYKSVGDSIIFIFTEKESGKEVLRAKSKKSAVQSNHVFIPIYVPTN